jgi:hypothetical protein
MFSNIKQIAKSNFNGIFAFGDTHSDYDSFRQAYDYAEANNLFFMSLGDLVDRGLFPFEVVSLMHKAVSEKKGGMVIGNHDDKFYRHAIGNKVRFSGDGKATLEHVGSHRMPDFLGMYTDIVEKSSYFVVIDDIILTHGATHEAMWDSSIKFTDEAKYRALYGEVTGEHYPDGYPIRYYGWADNIPVGRTAIVGHDRAPIHNELISEPLTYRNSKGGQVIFMDTGGGKGGHITGVVLAETNGKFAVDKFVDFKST